MSYFGNGGQREVRKRVDLGNNTVFKTLSNVSYWQEGGFSKSCFNGYEP